MNASSIRKFALVTLSCLGVAQLAFAAHETACKVLPTTGQRPGQVNYNPRQECLGQIPGNVHGPARAAAERVCNNMPASASRAGMVSFNPRQECLAALPPALPISISGIAGGNAGGNKTYAGNSDFMTIQGANVGMAGNTVTGEGGGFSAVLGPVPNCALPNCVGVNVTTQLNAEGTKTLVLRAAHGHSQARVNFEIVKAPQTQVLQPTKTPAAPVAIPIPYPASLPTSKFCATLGLRQADCEAKLKLYGAYMENLGAKVTLHNLHPTYIQMLQRFYPNVNLAIVQVGFSSNQQKNNATTDCSRIYFNNADYANRVGQGTLGNDADWAWLFHELRHTEQCAEWGSRDAFAWTWFKDFQLAVLQNELSPANIKKGGAATYLLKVHDTQPMEIDAENRAQAVRKSLGK